MKISRYIVEAELNGKPIRKIWRADHPLKIGHPEVWMLERTDAGIKVTKYHESRPLLPSGERSAEFEREVELTRDTLVRPFVVKADEHTRIHKLSILPAHTITPVFQGRAPGERTRVEQLTGQGSLEGEEFFVFTCFGNWVASSDVLETGLFRSDWIGYFAGRHAFKIRKSNEKKYILRCLVPQLDLKFQDHEYSMGKDQVLELTPEQLNTIEVHLGEAVWYFRKIRKAGQLPAEFQTVDLSTELLKKVAKRVGLAFVALMALMMIFYKPHVEAPPTRPVDIDFKRETIIVPKPVEVPVPPPIIEPPKEEAIVEPPKPAPPKPEPVKPKPKLMPKPEHKVSKPIVAPRHVPVAKQIVTTPHPVAVSKPAPAAPVAVHKPIPAVPAAPPPPTAAQIEAAEVAKALGALGAQSRTQIKVPSTTQYAKAGDNYKPSNVAAGSMSSQPSQINALSQQSVSTGTISSSGSRSISNNAVSGRELAGGKGLNGVQGRVSTNSVYKGAAGLGANSGQGMNVAGQGHLDPESIRKVLNAQLNRIQYCYEKSLLSNPSAAGGMTIGWTVQASGTVTGVQVLKSQISDPAMQNCVTQIIRGLHFPQPKGGSVQVDYPFQFTSSSI